MYSYKAWASITYQSVVDNYLSNQQKPLLRRARFNNFNFIQIF